MDATTRNMKDFKVAVVGGGMCGLAVAVGLTKAGVDVEIYEAAPKFGEIGAGVGLGPNAIRVLQELGVLDEVLSRADQDKPEVRPFLFLSGLGAHEQIYDYPVTPEDVGLGIHRAVFLDALVHLVDSSKTRFNKRCTNIRPSFSNPSRIRMNFADGTSSEADVVLGADGIRSITRTFVVGIDEESVDTGGSEKLVNAAYTNTLAYRGLVPDDKLKALGSKTDLSKRPHCFTGPGKHIITFPIKGGEIINVVAFACDRSIAWGERPIPPGQPWVTPRSRAELLAEYEGWGDDVQHLLGCLERPSVWAIHAVDPPLETYSNGRVAVLGDAAHGMLPHLGAGAGQGLEDTQALVRLLGHPQTNNHNVESVLQAYSVIRQPRGNMILARSTEVGGIHEGYGPSGTSIEGTRKDLSHIWDDVWHHDLQADIDQAVTWLQEKGVFT